MAENSVIISSEEEAKLLKPIDEYVEEIQKKIDALRADGFDKVSDLKKQIAIAKENKNLSATQRDKIIENKTKRRLENSKKSKKADNKEEIKKTGRRGRRLSGCALQKGLLRCSKQKLQSCKSRRKQQIREDQSRSEERASEKDCFSEGCRRDQGREIRAQKQTV